MPNAEKGRVLGFISGPSITYHVLVTVTSFTVTSFKRASRLYRGVLGIICQESSAEFESLIPFGQGLSCHFWRGQMGWSEPRTRIP